MSLGLLQNPLLQFGGMTFFARPHESDTCGTNGLPLTPNSITIIGKSQILKDIEHPNLCRYLDIIRSKHERIIVVSQIWGESLEKYSQEKKVFNEEELFFIAYQILNTLKFLHEKDIVHRNLSPENIYINKENQIKFFNYGLYYMTGDGKYVPFPIGTPKYMAPEALLAGPMKQSLGPKPDLWSVGIILAELALGITFWTNLKLKQLLRKILSLLEGNGSTFERIAREHNCLEKYQNLSPELTNLIESCLQVTGYKRLTTAEILQNSIFDKFKIENESESERKKKLCAPFTIVELYYWWQLAGGDIYTELKKEGLILNKPPILNLPKVVLLDGKVLGGKRREETLLDLRVVPVNLDSLYKRFSHIPLKCFYPLIRTTSKKINDAEPEPYDADQLPLIIREKDPEYQFHRVILLGRMLKGYPSTRDLIVKEAKIDIPPLLRGPIWAALLNVGGSYVENYIRIDKETQTSTDRQIEVDIPRCHQYNELLSSGEGHRKLKRILKAWVVRNPEYVYWQGLDSLTAPFLYLNFNNEARAYACLSEFIPKYLHKFFLKDNSAIIQEYLAKFSQIIAFHDPQLANHLHSISFIPELFAIPWFLTMFSHVFPLHKILHLWDKLLLGDSSFPLFIGLAVLHQLRDTLLSSGFNECILLFSDLPEVDIAVCVSHSVEKYSSTQRSITLRKHQNGGWSSNSELDISDVELRDLQLEFCPRISANDVVHLLNNSPDQIIIVDIRPAAQYNRAAVKKSINVPFALIQQEDPNIECLGPQAAVLKDNLFHTIVVVAAEHVQAEVFSRYLVQCEVSRVCILHGGINILYSVTPTILISN
ncbi:TBC domain-containing protein kinase-like protein, partial [Chrysoperla carnea]|uniref:TBC domain-containing protein kinase-like protein n=1 Tax=Chrysoperla carnea TaxID=189513 RepID=UPI001D093035